MCGTIIESNIESLLNVASDKYIYYSRSLTLLAYLESREQGKSQGHIEPLSL